MSFFGETKRRPTPEGLTIRQKEAKSRQKETKSKQKEIKGTQYRKHLVVRSPYVSFCLEAPTPTGTAHGNNPSECSRKSLALDRLVRLVRGRTWPKPRVVQDHGWWWFALVLTLYDSESTNFPMRNPAKPRIQKHLAQSHQCPA